ncbi:hypothetical protein T4C_7062 [Trichinella pseudospiralis]|uniref:Uncharacterized protein n=1 Tax=Trichinella pseudospiralis TaxID=6337 RepID=A0A0V1IYN4_TRIPS|nr:hypothetical protein T4C_7062 [Trichinella pseudospiralis]
MHARVTNPSASSRHLAKASKDNSIFRRLADYGGGQRPFFFFFSCLTIACQLRAKVFGSSQKEFQHECNLSLAAATRPTPSFDGRSVSLATFCTPTLRNLTLGYEHRGT